MIISRSGTRLVFRGPSLSKHRTTAMTTPVCSILYGAGSRQGTWHRRHGAGYIGRRTRIVIRGGVRGVRLGIELARGACARNISKPRGANRAVRLVMFNIARPTKICRRSPIGWGGFRRRRGRSYWQYPAGTRPRPPVLHRREGIDRSRRCWVKLSAAYQLSKTGAPSYSDYRAMALALVAMAPERMLWGTNCRIRRSISCRMTRIYWRRCWIGRTMPPRASKSSSIILQSYMGSGMTDRMLETCRNCWRRRWLPIRVPPSSTEANASPIAPC